MRPIIINLVVILILFVLCCPVKAEYTFHSRFKTLKAISGVQVKDTDSTLQKAIQLASDVLVREYTPAKLNQLIDLCRIWGFLKYYHPAVTKGLYDWDSVLITLLPRVMTAPAVTAYRIEEQLVDSLGAVPPCDSCHLSDKETGKIILQPDYDGLFTHSRLPVTLLKKLAFIRDNHPADINGYYLQIDNHVPVVRNESNYGNTAYPAAAIRLITLFRYWNIIEYFYPSRHLIKEGWHTMLPEFIPRFIRVTNKQEYVLACLGLISHLHDTHANIYNIWLESFKGMYITPFQAKFVEGQLVVTGYYTDSPAIKSTVHIGDIIKNINRIPVDSLIRRYSSLTPASNETTQFRDLPGMNGWLLRGDTMPVTLTIQRDRAIQQVTVRRISLFKAKMTVEASDISEKPAYTLLPGGIGYINAGNITENSFDTIHRLFQDTKGLIIDMRCYPATFMPFIYGAWLKPRPSLFARFATCSPEKPGAFISVDSSSNGGSENAAAVSPTYGGKLVIIVSSATQSQGEYTTMAFQSVPGAIVVGSTTAGADGNVSQLTLPGGIYTVFTGMGVYYPDWTATQRVGVRIDIPVHRTIRGIREGRDEYLEAALRALK